MDEKTRQFPFETEHLDKGSIITGQTIEEAYQVQRGTDAFQLALLRATDYVTRRLAERGLDVVTKQRKHDLLILTDAEASAELANRTEQAVRSIRKNHKRLVDVDVENLNSEQQTAHAFRQMRSGRLWHALRDATKALPEIPDTARLTPGRDEC